MAPAPQQNGYGPQQNAYLPPQAELSSPPQFPQPAGIALYGPEGQLALGRKRERLE